MLTLNFYCVLLLCGWSFLIIFQISDFEKLKFLTFFFILENYCNVGHNRANRAYTL